MSAQLELQKLYAIENANTEFVYIVEELKAKKVNIKKFNLKTDSSLACGYELFLDKEVKLSSIPKNSNIEVVQDPATKEIFIKISQEIVMKKFADKKFSSALDKDFSKYWESWSDLVASSVHNLYDWNNKLSNKKIK